MNNRSEQIYSLYKLGYMPGLNSFQVQKDVIEKGKREHRIDKLAQRRNRKSSRNKVIPSVFPHELIEVNSERVKIADNGRVELE